VRHDAAERIDFLHEVALADAADGRVARHLADGLGIVGQQQGLGPEPRARRSRLGAGMAAADHDHIISLGMPHR